MYRASTLVLVLASAFILTGPAGAADKSKKRTGKGPQGDDEMAAMMAELMKNAAPGEHHRHLQPMVGTWKTTTRFRQVPNAPWNESTGRAVFEWILGGRFLTQKVESPPTEVVPVAFEGFGLLGHDNIGKKYISIWMDNFFTGAMVFNGSCDDSGKVITFAGEFENPLKGGAKTYGRWVYKIINDNKFVLEMWEPDANGDEFLHGEITYARVK